MTREEVVRGLEICTSDEYCTVCPLYDDGSVSTCMPALMDAALALLKQERTEIVRCKSCRHYNTECCADGFGWCHRRDFGTNDEWYCADGEVGTYDEG